MRTNAGFWDRIAVRYSRQPIADEVSYQRKLEVTRCYFRPDMDVLEFGSGTGSTALQPAPHVRHIRAVDVSTKMIEIARGKAAAGRVDNVIFEPGRIEDRDAADRAYDAVLGLNIPHLLADRAAVIAKVRRLLKPGGVFVTSTVCLGESANPIRYVLPIGRMLGVLPLVRVFTAADLEASLTAGGFAIDHIWRHDKGKVVFIVAKAPA